MAVEEVDSGDDGEITVGPGLIRGGKYYIISHGDGTITLMPADSVPEDERIIWENKAVRESRKRGMDQAARGELVEVDDLFDDLDE